MFVDNTKYNVNLRKHRVFSEDHRKKLAEAATGRKGYWTGKTRPDSTRKKMSAKRLNAYNIKYEYKGKTIRDWAEYFQIDNQQIYAFVKKHGIENIESFISASELTKYKGKSYAQWARELNVAKSNISYHMKKYGHLDNIGKQINAKSKKVDI